MNTPQNLDSLYEEVVVPPPAVIDTTQLYKVRVKFSTPVLGSKPMNRSLFEKYMMPRNPNPSNNIEDLGMIEYGIEHVNSLLRKSNEDFSELTLPNNSKVEDDEEDEEDLDTSGITGFLCDEKLEPYFDAHLPKALFKEAWTARKQNTTTLSSKMKTGKSIISRQIFISGTEPKRPTKLRLHVPFKEKISILSRALRAETKMGPRNALAVSVILPEHTWFEFFIRVLSPDVVKAEHLHEWLSYGEFNGFGQFRGGNYGQFSYTLSLMQRKNK